MKGRKPKLGNGDGGAALGRCPKPPAWLSPYAKAEWKRAAPELHGRRLLTPDVLATLESYVTAAGTIRECEDIMQAEGRIIEGEKGKSVHPAFKVQQGAMREARLLAAELGLTPHRRYAAPAPDDGEDDDVPAGLLG
ncbi:MAG TPA: phage terminase small subunit P27 family [Azospirillaceae bacterium]|nr:phage terminase small subunit P27 family [Azospirillaceae bacterium]